MAWGPDSLSGECPLCPRCHMRRTLIGTPFPILELDKLSFQIKRAPQSLLVWPWSDCLKLFVNRPSSQEDDRQSSACSNIFSRAVMVGGGVNKKNLALPCELWENPPAGQRKNIKSRIMSVEKKKKTIVTSPLSAHLKLVLAQTLLLNSMRLCLHS